MKNRLSVYEAQTKPLIDYYQKAGLYLEIDGRQAIDKVFKVVPIDIVLSKRTRYVLIIKLR